MISHNEEFSNFHNFDDIHVIMSWCNAKGSEESGESFLNTEP